MNELKLVLLGLVVLVFSVVLLWIFEAPEIIEDKEVEIASALGIGLLILVLVEPHGITFDSKETVLELNGCSIEAYPSNHIDAFRSLTNPRFILLDECDFFPKHQQEEVRHVAERYIAKSDPFICMVSNS